MKELLLFQAGNIQVGLDLPLVKSIHSVNARFADQAGKSHKLVQVIDGEEFLLYDLPSIFRDEKSSGNPMSQKVILVEAHEHPIALGVDRVERVVSVNSEHIQPLPPIFNGLPLRCFPRVVKHEKELILLFNPAGIENLAQEIPDTKTDTSEPEAVKSSPEDITIPGPMTEFQTTSDISETPSDSSQKSKVGNEDPASDIPYSEFTSPAEIEREQSDLDDYLPETIDIDPDFEEETTSRLVEKARIAREELLQKEAFQPEENILSDEKGQVEIKLSAMVASLKEMTPDTEDSDAYDTEEKTAIADVDETAAEISKETFQPEESILSGEQEQVGPELLALDASLGDMTPDTEDSNAHDTEEKTAVADANKIATETSPDEDKAETGAEGDHFEAATVDPATESYDELPGETPSEEEKDEVDKESLLISSIGISLDSQDESGSPIEEEEPFAVDVLSQVAMVQPEGIIYLKEAKAALETPEPESTDPFRSAKEDKNMPPLPVGEVPYLFADVSTESEPIPIEPAEEVSLKEAKAMVETLEEESTDPFRSVKEDKEMPLLPVGEVPYLFAAVSAESEPIPIEPAEEISLKEAEATVEIPEPESTDHLGSEKEDAATLLMPFREEPSLVDLASIESEPISKEPPHVTLLNSSDIVTPASGNRSEKVLTPTGLPRELKIDHGKQKGSYRRPVVAGVLALIALLLLSMWLWPKSSLRIPKVVRKPIPMAYAVGEVRKNPEELSQATQPFGTEDQSLSQTSKPLNTNEKSTGSAHASLRAGPEVFKIETNDFTLTVERPKATNKNGRQTVSAGIIVENELSHIVIKDDTLWQIAERYLDDPFRYPELAKTSRISDPDQIYPGDIVRIIKKKKQRKGKQGKSSQERSKDGNR